MAGADTATFDEVLKVVYGPGIAELIRTKTRVLDMFTEGDSSQWGGKFVEYPVNVRRSEGAGYASESGLLPSAGREIYADMRIPCRYHYGRITVTAQVMKQSQGGKNAFAPAMEREMAGVVKAMAADRGRAILHDGRGVLAVANGGGSSASQSVNNAGGVSNATNGARFIRPGMIVGCINPSTGDVRASTVGTVQSIASNGAQITLDASKTWTSGDYLVRFTTTGATSVTDTSYGKEVMGLLGLVDDGTYVATLHNINRTTFPMFSSKVISSVGALSADVLQRASDVAEEVGDGDISDFVMHHSVRRAYLALMESDRRYIGKDLSTPDAGTNAVGNNSGKLTFGGLPITEDKYSPYGIIFALDRSGFKRWALVDGEWADEDGAVLCRVGSGTSAADQFEAFYRIWDNFSNDYPNRSARLDGVTATVVVVAVP
jgi:hypothetical protein